MKKMKTIICEDCGTSVTCLARTTTRFCRPCAHMRKSTRAGKNRAALQRGKKLCSLCGSAPVREGNRWLCFECHTIPDRDPVGDGNLKTWSIHLTSLLQDLSKNISERANILTTSPRTLLKYPQAKIVSKRYIQKPRAYGPGRFSS